jgi:hypothetical protein
VLELSGMTSPFNNAWRISDRALIFSIFCDATIDCAIDGDKLKDEIPC